jgi:hypothetical protein
MGNSTSITATEALRKLVTGTESRTKIARLRGMMPDVEAAKEAGISNKKIVETLNEHGFEITQKTFEMMLYRLRKERRQGNQKKPDGEGNQKNQVATPQELTPKEGQQSEKKEPKPKSALPILRKSEVNFEDYINPED